MSNSTASQPGGTWYVFAGGEVKGPYLREDLLSLLRMGLVASDAQFSCGGEWMDRSTFESDHHCQDDDLPVLEPLPEADSGQISSEHTGSPEAEAAYSPSDAFASKSFEIPHTSLPVRDRIVVIGRRAAGKTIYLAELYHQLWKSQDGMYMKALSGRSHKELMSVHETLRQGQWPAATDRTTVLQMEFEVHYRGHTRTLVGLDYAGEVFRDAFVNDDTESPQARALVSHIDRAAAVILLIDPAVAVSNDSDAMIDDDYGIVQAIQRIRDWPGGEDVPLVVLLTKADQNRALFKNREDTRRFMETHYPALKRTLKHFKVFHISAVQTVAGSEGTRYPKRDSIPLNLTESLKYCLDCLNEQKSREMILKQQQAEREAMEREIEFQSALAQRSNRKLYALIAAMITIGVCAMALILVFLG